MGGTVFLYDETETLVRVREYRFPGERNIIVETWRLAIQKKEEELGLGIGELFLKMAIHITPNARPDWINLDGTNSTKQPLHQMPEPLKPKIDRPAAVYSNNKSLYGDYF